MQPLVSILLLSLLPACLAQTGTRTRAMLLPPGPEVSATLDHLIATARAKRLSQSRTWLRLGHYRSTLTGTIESEVDGDNFFLSPRGRTDPDAELVATLRGFYSELKAFDDKAPEHRSVQHPICQFPARFAFLSAELPLDVTPPPCPRYEEFVSTLKPRAITLVFSSYFLNNPASAFGHTFLRISKKDDAVAEEKRQLLDFGIDYSAAVDTTFAPVYAVKGIFGLFPGVFGKIPFYYKVREYNDFESRDLWEYDLSLDETQVAMVIAHVWELGSTFFRYYYLTGNCSYRIIQLIDLARPDLSLVDQLHTPVLPADTVKIVARTPGLIRAIRFRPSLRTQFRARVDDLSTSQRAAIETLAAEPDTKLDGLDDRQRIAVLDAAQDLVDILHAKEMVSSERSGPGVKLKQRLLERRASILLPSADQRFEPPWRTMPQLGHPSRRVSFGAGTDDEGGRWLELGGRLAMHDLADPAMGYPELAELEFAPFRLRWDLAAEELRLDQLDLVHIRSLTAQDRFDRKISWEARLGSERRPEACDCYGFHVQVGGGLAVSFVHDAIALYLLAQSHLWISGGDAGIRESAFGIGVGPGLGARLRFARSLVSLTTAEWLWLPDQRPTTRLRVESTLRWELFRRRLALDLTGRATSETLSATAATMLYF